MSKVTLTIDGIQITVPKGTTVLEAAEQAGIFIPTFCHDPELSRPGACRICVVEIPGARNLPASCVTEATEGMVVNTATPAVIEARKTNLELLLANHPADCLTCEKNGGCRLQDYAYYYGVRQDAFKGEKHNYPIEDNNPFIVRDMNKCILCGKCIRICEEIQGNDVINFAYRGFSSIVTPAMGATLSDTDISNCVFCGNCVAVCPVGALSEKAMLGKARQWEIKKVKTTCPYCGVGCQFDLNVKDGKVIGVTSTDNDLNRRSLCVKGRFGYGFIHHPDRLTTPLIKKDGEFVEATWDEAIGLIAEKIGSIKNKFGADAIGLLSSARVTNEENYLMNKLARAAIGTNNIDHCARLCHAPTVAGMATAYGSGAMTNSFAEIKNADFILITGTNTTDTHPVAGAMIKQAARNGSTLVAVDPRKTELARMADYHLQIKSGTDIALINGLANVIIAEDLWDKDFVNERTEDFDAFKAAVSKYTPEYVEGITGIKADVIREVARGYARANNAMIFFTMGITQHICGTHNVFSIANLCMLCGHIGKESSGVNPLRGQNNVQGACDMGALPVVYTGYQGLAVEENRKKFAAAWNVKELPAKTGLTVGELLAECGKGIKGMYIMGENPIISDPDANNVMHELKNLDFLAVQDIFLTETAQLADVVLPGASFAEKDGTFTNTERRVQLVRKAIEPIGSSKPDWEILCLVATAMGYPMSYSSAEEIMAEVASVTPSYAGISFARLEKGGLQWPCPSAEHPGTKFLHSGKFARGLGKFHAVEHIPPDELPDNEYPYILSTGRRRYHYHTGSMTQRTGALEVFYPTEYLEISCADAEVLGVCDGDKVKVTSRRGQVEVAAKITDTVVPGLVFTSFQYPDVPINRLTNPARDPISKIPDLKVCAVKVEKVS